MRSGVSAAFAFFQPADRALDVAGDVRVELGQQFGVELSFALEDRGQLRVHAELIELFPRAIARIGGALGRAFVFVGLVKHGRRPTGYQPEMQMAYVDGYVLPVPTKNLGAYRKMAAHGGKIWRDHGALEYRECAGDDLQAKFGMPFPKLMKLKRGETVVFAWIVFKSKARPRPRQRQGHERSRG